MDATSVISQHGPDDKGTFSPRHPDWADIRNVPKSRPILVDQVEAEVAAEVGDGATVEFDEVVGGHPEAFGVLAEAAVFAIVLDDDPVAGRRRGR